jgi:RNA polymerase sigma-70 factor (sigma-E family)
MRTTAEEEAAYTDFVHEQWASLYRTALLMTGEHQRAEDVTQAALMKVYLAWPRVRAMDHPAAYARTILVHQLTSWWRLRSSSEVPSLVLVDGAEPPFDDRVVEARAIWSHVLALPARQRAVVVLRYYEDRTEAEIAEILGISPGSVKTHAHHALSKLRPQLREALGQTRLDDPSDLGRSAS